MVTEGLADNASGCIGPGLLVGDFINSMVARIRPSHPNGQAIIRASNRSMAYSDSTDLDIAEWLGDNPDVTRITDDPTGQIEAIPYLRITAHVGRSVRVSPPPTQQIRFETPSHNLGIGGALVSEVEIRLFIRRIFLPATPCPNHFAPGRFRGCETPDTLQIAALSRRLIACRIDGLSLTGGNLYIDLDPLLVSGSVMPGHFRTTR